MLTFWMVCLQHPWCSPLNHRRYGAVHCRSSSTGHPLVLDLLVWPVATAGYTQGLLMATLEQRTHRPPAEQQTRVFRHCHGDLTRVMSSGFAHSMVVPQRTSACGTTPHTLQGAKHSQAVRSCSCGDRVCTHFEIIQVRRQRARLDRRDTSLA